MKTERIILRISEEKKQQIKKIVPDGNVSMFLRMKIDEEIKNTKKMNKMY